VSLDLKYDLGDQDPGNCLPWTPDFELCCAEFLEYDEALRTRALGLAWSTLHALSGGRVGSCPVWIRPCTSPEPCAVCFDGSWLSPFVDANGNWRNAACRPKGNCSCCDMCEIVRPGRVASIEQVLVDGYTIDKQLFRIDNGRVLVRQDGGCWPSCQNLGAPLGAIGTFGIKYIPGVLPNEAGMWAAATLACEYAKACTGGKCRLPAAVTSITRQGVSMTFGEEMFANGTGIREVDAYIYSLNPNRLKVAPQVWSPDLPGTRHRVRTFQAIAFPTGP
jgi:hypothetical protein